MLQQLAELQNQAGSPSQEGQQPGTDSTRSPGAQSQGAGINASSTDVEFAELAARSLSECLRNGTIFNVPGTAEFDGNHSARLGPGTSLGYVTSGNYEEFEKALLRAARESEAGEIYCIMATTDNMQGLTTRSMIAIFRCQPRMSLALVTRRRETKLPRTNGSKSQTGGGEILQQAFSGKAVLSKSERGLLVIC